MGKTSSDRSAKVAKAGKRSGGFTMPPAKLVENQAGRDQGQQQFIAKQQLTVKREVPVLVWDKALNGVVRRIRTVTISTDYAMDTARGQIISSPKFQEAAGNKSKKVSK